MKTSLCVSILIVIAAMTPAGSAVGAANPAPAPEGVWSLYYSSDLKVYAANLRAAGAPENVVALLISDAVNAHFAARETALRPAMKSAKTLKEEFAPERRQALLDLHREKNEMLRQALGRIREQKAIRTLPTGVISRLSEADRDAVLHITDDYGEMVVSIINAAHGYLLDDDREKIRFLEGERTVDLGKYLTAEEILDYELLETGYGRSLRTRLRLMEPTQEELGVFLSVAKKHGYHLANSDMNSSRVLATRRAMDAELRSIWGSERYADYRRSVSFSFREIDRLVSRLKLPKEVAPKVFESQKTTTEQGTAVFTKVHGDLRRKTDAGYGHHVILLPEPQLQTAAAVEAKKTIVGLIEEHLAFVRTQLGEDGYRQYEALFDAMIKNMRSGGSSQMDYSRD